MNNKEDIMDNDKTKATESSAAASEPLVLRPEWEYKPKDLDEPKQSKFVLTHHEDTLSKPSWNLIDPLRLSLHLNLRYSSPLTCKVISLVSS